MYIDTKYQIGALSVLVLFLIVFSAWVVIHPQPFGKTSTVESPAPSPLHLQKTESGGVVPPPMSATMRKVINESRGFQALVSYTDQGFEPPMLSIRKDDTVRFTNNSSRDVWVASSGTPYPGGDNSCGQNAFDSCFSLKPLEFWEFTFNEKGEWRYVDNLHKEFTGTVLVR